MLWIWLLNNIVDIIYDNEFDYLMMMGLCDDYYDVDFDMICYYYDEVILLDDNKQFQKFYEEYLQLIKVDYYDYYNDDDNDDDYNDGDEGYLDLFVEFFFI